LDGFRALAYLEEGACRLVSRHGNQFRMAATLAAAIARDLASRTAILDGEIVYPGPDGRPAAGDAVCDLNALP
jgi:bifunctional non-homologous end joining protein LigD